MKEQMILLVTIINLMLIAIILIFLIRRNILRLEKKKITGTLIDAEVTKWKALSGQPTRYILEVEYEMEDKKYIKKLITSGKFTKKYEKERTVPIVVIQDTNKIYFKEEDWKRQNIFLISLIILILPALILFLFFHYLPH